MLNLYEILEVSEKASKEVIDKAYHVLAKKYHPDLQDVSSKSEAENKMKKINEAYEILGNEEKRKQYDIELEQKRQEEKTLEDMQKSKEYEQVQYSQNQNIQELRKEEIQSKQVENNNIKNIEREIKRAYTNAYYDYLRGLRL